MHLEFKGPIPGQATARSRRLFERDNLSTRDLMQVVLVVGDEIAALPGGSVPVFTHRQLPSLAAELRELGIRQIKLFAAEREKGNAVARATAPDSALVRAIRELKACDPDLYIAVETCLCPYTESGSCGVHDDHGTLDLAHTKSAFASMALRHAEAGADAVGPASMIPGCVKACRSALDEAGWLHVGVMPHLIMRSPFYGPYRAVMGTDGAGAEASRRPFQIDARERRPAVGAARRFVEEGADSILMEPALFILDTVRDVHEAVDVPLGCFSVSGEYQLLKGDNGDPNNVALLEFCRSAKRAGARFIATYGAREIARTLMRSTAP